jgi:hypothetical protein
VPVFNIEEYTQVQKEKQDKKHPAISVPDEKDQGGDPFNQPKHVPEPAEVVFHKKKTPSDKMIQNMERGISSR